jgi:lipoprotein-anchoring transpeptidase ErfK/SrfK
MRFSAIPLMAFLVSAGWVSAAPAAPRSDLEPLRLEVSLSERHLYEFADGELVNVFDISVGKAGHETPTGTFRIHRIDWNPDWTPPDSEWAEGHDPTPPGHEDNPMGRVRMVYQAPYSIHGTEVLESLGEAQSHGSIRMGNDDIIELAKRVMAAGGAERSAGWYEEVLGNPTRMYSVELSDPVRLITTE